MNLIKNLIIGAGPAGLAVAGRMRNAGLEFEMLEQSENVGNAWHHHYDRLHLHTVKQYSYLPFMEFPEDYPTYVSRKQLTKYFEIYADKFNIHPQFGTEVTIVKKSQNGNWEVNTKSGKKLVAENIVIATGVNRIPHIPKFKGQDNFKGKIIHSRLYKNPQPFLNQRVLVIGMGNTGAEIALDLSEHDVPVYISVRSPINIVPRDLNGQPVQVTSKRLEKLPWGLGDWLGSKIRAIYFGDLKKYNIESSKMYPVVQLRETGKTPVIDIGTVAAIKAGKITVVKDIDYFTQRGVQFKNGEHIEFDQVILATGYRAKIEDLIEKGNELLDKHQIPKAPIADGFHKGLYFVGFDQYKLGGIFGTIFTDSEKIVEELK